MKPGDLVRYNVGGSRDKTLAMVLDISKRYGIGGLEFISNWQREHGYLTKHDTGIVTVQWLQVDGKYLPRKVSSEMVSSNWDRPVVGEIAAHPLGSWFEVVSN